MEDDKSKFSGPLHDISNKLVVLKKAYEKSPGKDEKLYKFGEDALKFITDKIRELKDLTHKANISFDHGPTHTTNELIEQIKKNIDKLHDMYPLKLKILKKTQVELRLPLDPEQFLRVLKLFLEASVVDQSTEVDIIFVQKETHSEIHLQTNGQGELKWGDTLMKSIFLDLEVTQIKSTLKNIQGLGSLLILTPPRV